MWRTTEVNPLLLALQSAQSRLITTTSEKDNLSQENLALRAEVEHLKSALSQYRERMGYYFGIATEIRAASREQMKRERREELISLHKLNPCQSEEWLVGHFSEKVKDSLKRLKRISELGSRLMNRISLDSPLVGTPKVTESFCQCRTAKVTIEVACCEVCQAQNPKR